MPFEVEMKFPLNDSSQLLRLLHELDAVAGTPIEQCDCYFNHPVRDFAETDEAVRVRTVGDQSFVTYKGPLLDAITKTRHETELPIGQTANDGRLFGDVLRQLGFSTVREVRKTRVPYTFSWENRSFEVVLDDVVGLGTFVEIETIADDDAAREIAAESLLRLSKRLGLEHSQRRSYLSLLLEADEKMGD